MPVPSWVSAFGHVLSDVFGAALGFAFVEQRKATAERVGKVIHDKVIISSDVRAGVMKDLILCGKECLPLLRLFEDANRVGYVFDPHGHRMLEARLVDLFAKIRPQDRPWVYRYWAGVYQANPGRFFALVNMINDDGWLQMIILARDLARDHGIPIAQAFGILVQNVFRSTARGFERINQRAENARAGLAPLIERAEARLQEQLDIRARRRTGWFRNIRRRPDEGSMRDPFGLDDFEDRYFGRRS